MGAFSSEVGTGRVKKTRQIKTSAIPAPNKKAAGNRRPSLVRNAIAYSAATLRGGSSAPESWISAT
jgi:hypothetical protein